MNPNLPAGWSRMNRRRCELLDRKRRDGLTAREETELAGLQAYASAVMDQVFPVPTQMLDELEALAERLEQEDAQRTSEDLQEKYLPPVATLINKTVDEYSRENNLAIVFDPRTEPSNIVFVHVASDITAEIIRRMNAAYAKDPKLIAPSAAAASPAAPPKPTN